MSGGLSFFNLPDTAGQVAIHAVENLHGGLSVDGPQVSSGLRRPGDRDPLGSGRFGHLSFTKVIYPGLVPNVSRFSRRGMPRGIRSSAVGFATMTDAANLDGVGIGTDEEEPVVANAQP